MRKHALSQRSELVATLARYKREFLMVGLLSLVTNLLALTPSLYMLQVFDRVMASRSELTLIAVSLITLFLFVMMGLAEWLRSMLLVRLGLRLDEAFGHRVFDASFEARLNRGERNPARAFADLTNLRQFITSNGVIALFDLPWLPIYLTVLFLMHPWLGGLSLFGALALGAMGWLTERYTAQGVEQIQEASTQADQFMQSKLRNAELIESMGMLGHLRLRWLTRHRQYLLLSGNTLRATQYIKSLTKFLRYSMQSLVLGVGALLVIDGSMSPWVIIVGNMILARALAPVDLAIATWRGFVSARASFHRLEALLAAHPEGTEGTFHVAPHGNVALVNLSARAPGRDEPILKNLSLAIPAGEVIGIVGPSGSGKSTLARVLMGIWPEVQGEIMLDGETLSSWSREKLGPHVGYLPQDVQLFDGSIAENIARFGKIDSPQVIRAAQQAGVHEMIQRFPMGYNTPAGPGGSYLSGGQRQRIGLARAIYGEPALIVLDEPNSNLDEAGENALRTTIQQLKAQGKTVVLITHRLGVLNSTDKIMELRQGTVHWYGPREDFAQRAVASTQLSATAN